ncbi:MAG: twin-arginine translocase subunit TatB [Rhodocyclaceae bacterium]|nr:twin-arginine translocase subunit TatB [Rhodocyclaceae bacterium]
MFDIGFTELMIIGVVGLVVIGPERLPRVARTVGHLLGRAQRYVSDVKSDISREMQLEDLKKLQREVADSARDLENSMRDQAASLKGELDATASALNATVDDVAKSAEAASAPAQPAPDDAALRAAEQSIADTVGRPPAGDAAEDESQLPLGLQDAAPDAPKENKA